MISERAKLIIGAVSIKCDSVKDLDDLKTIILNHKGNIHELSKNESRFFVKNFTRGFTKLLALGKRAGATDVKSIQEYIYTVVKGYVQDAYRVKILENGYAEGSHKRTALIKELTSSLAVYKKELLSSNYLDDMVFNFDNVNKNISAIQFGKRSYKITHTYNFASAIKSLETYIKDAFEAITKPQPTANDIYSSNQLSHSFNLAIKNMPDNLEDKKSDLERVKNIVDFPVYNPAALVLTAIEVVGEGVFDKNNNNGEYLLDTKNILEWVTTQINGINAGFQSEKNVGRLEHFKQMINSENFPQIKLTFDSNGLPVITFGSDIDWNLSANKNFILNALRAIMQNASSLKLIEMNILNEKYSDRMDEVELDIARSNPGSHLLYVDGTYESLKEHIPAKSNLIEIKEYTLDTKLKLFLVKQLISSLTVSELGCLISKMGNVFMTEKFVPINKFTICKDSDDSTEILVDLEVEGEWKDATINMTCTLVINKELLNNFFSPKDLLGLNPITKIKYHDVNAKLGSMPTIQKMSTAEGMNFYL